MSFLEAMKSNLALKASGVISPTVVSTLRTFRKPSGGGRVSHGHRRWQGQSGGATVQETSTRTQTAPRSVYWTLFWGNDLPVTLRHAN